MGQVSKNVLTKNVHSDCAKLPTCILMCMYIKIDTDIAHLSREEANIYFPFGEKRTNDTGGLSSSTRVLRHRPVTVSHMRLGLVRGGDVNTTPLGVYTGSYHIYTIHTSIKRAHERGRV